MDWAAKRAAAEAKIALVAERGTITFTSKALNKVSTSTTLDVWVLIRTREVSEQGKPAKITALVTATDRNIEGGVLTCEGKRYQIDTIEQMGAGSNHLLTKVVAVEL